MVFLSEVVQGLNQEFQIQSFGKDSAFSRFIPSVYEPIHYDWRAAFEHDFCDLFNGLMIKGAPVIGRVFLAVFPTDYVLEKFLEESQEGDLLFMHHPLVMECGDPQGEWGKGFVPIKERYISQLKEKKLSVYTCHVPMDYHPQLGTSLAIVKALNAQVVDGFVRNKKGDNLILVCDIPETNTTNLIESLKDIFDLPYVDFEGKSLEFIQKVAIVAGCGDKAQWMKDAETMGVQAYITGEIHCHIDNEYGKQKYQQMMEYVSETSMSLIGVSHSASEYLVKKTLMKDWFERNFEVNTALIPQEKWWL